MVMKKNCLGLLAAGRLMALLVVLLVNMPAYAAEDDFEATRADEGLQLPQKYTELLRDEMQLLEQEMQSLLPAIARAEWQLVHDKGLRIYNSLIMRQRLSRQEHEELHHLLPAAFLQLDMQFHDYGKRLALAAEAGDGELVGYYYGRMVQGCIACHDQFASQRFATTDGARSDGHRYH